MPSEQVLNKLMTKDGAELRLFDDFMETYLPKYFSWKIGSS